MEERFWSKVDKKGENGCWNWMASMRENGYGQIYKDGKPAKAHRVSYELFVGKIPEGLCVLHSCDNRKCVNPAHLSVDTQKENLRQMRERYRDNTAKGDNSGSRTHPERRPRGETHCRSKLTNNDIYEVKILYGFGFTHRELGLMYNVAHSSIANILNGKSWNHL